MYGGPGEVFRIQLVEKLNFVRSRFLTERDYTYMGIMYGGPGEMFRIQLVEKMEFCFSDWQFASQYFNFIFPCDFFSLLFLSQFVLKLLLNSMFDS